jgi:deoxyribodipyrimidine photo-lyase
MSVPPLRIAARNAAPPRPDRRYVLYWMIAARRTRWNFGLEHAVAAAVRMRKPLVVLEALRCDYRYACDRFHRFVLDGMSDNAQRLAASGVTYVRYVEPEPGAGKGLLAALASAACLVVTDEFPCFFLPRMVESAARRLDVRVEAVDGNGLLPLRDAETVFPSAYAFRRHLQKRLPAHLDGLPEADPLAAVELERAAVLPERVAERWPSADGAIASLPIDHAVGPVAGRRGGERAGGALLETFVDRKLARYAEDRNEPDTDGASGLSPYLHFGHVSIHQILTVVASREGWSPRMCAATASGRREGWWGLSPAAESFLDEAVTWRELGYNFCSKRSDFDRFASLPEWAQATLAKHAADPRAVTYDLETFAESRTHDPLWNAAQRQLVVEGRIHNYLRMLWGKKILEWTRSPEDALDVMIELNNRFALDGRNPNSYSGIFWVLGRYDRPWGPERPIFGTVRYMSSENTARKMSVAGYLGRYGPERRDRDDVPRLLE